MGHCHFCGREVTDENFCHGCNHHVCQLHVGEVISFDNHTVEAHQPKMKPANYELDR